MASVFASCYCDCAGIYSCICLAPVSVNHFIVPCACHLPFCEFVRKSCYRATRYDLVPVHGCVRISLYDFICAGRYAFSEVRFPWHQHLEPEDSACACRPVKREFGRIVHEEQEQTSVRLVTQIEVVSLVDQSSLLKCKVRKMSLERTVRDCFRNVVPWLDITCPSEISLCIAVSDQDALYAVCAFVIAGDAYGSFVNQVILDFSAAVSDHSVVCGVGKCDLLSARQVYVGLVSPDKSTCIEVARVQHLTVSSLEERRVSALGLVVSDVEEQLHDFSGTYRGTALVNIHVSV